MRPEDQIRAALVEQMVEKLGYPRSLIQIEQSLHTLPHLKEQANLPNRRVDILVFRKTDGQPLPWLLVECKAIPLSDRALRQVAGYNHFVGAPFIAVANQTEVRTGWLDPQTGDLEFAEGLPNY